MTNAVQALIPRPIFDDAALYRHLEHLHMMFQHSGELFWMLVINQVIMAPMPAEVQEERYALLLDVLEKCRQLQENIRTSVDVIMQLVNHRQLRLELSD